MPMAVDNEFEFPSDAKLSFIAGRLAAAYPGYIEDQGYAPVPSNNVQPDGERFWDARASRPRR